ncbi:MAG: hypothetical protein DIU72_011120, partial [Pseudomonadota bacterium]
HAVARKRERAAGEEERDGSLVDLRHELLARVERKGDALRPAERPSLAQKGELDLPSPTSTTSPR